MDQKKYRTRKYWIVGLLLCLCAMAWGQPSYQTEDEAFTAVISEMIEFSIPVMGVSDAKKVHGKATFLDARSFEEYNVSHIPGAIWIGYDTFSEDRVSSIAKDAMIIVYCSIGYRSEKIAEQLRARGFVRVYNLFGSIFEWVNQGKEIEDSSGHSTYRIHTYNRRWSQWVRHPKAQKTW